MFKLHGNFQKRNLCMFVSIWYGPNLFFLLSPFNVYRCSSFISLELLIVYANESVDIHVVNQLFVEVVTFLREWKGNCHFWAWITPHLQHRKSLYTLSIVRMTLIIRVNVASLMWKTLTCRGKLIGSTCEFG